MPLSGNHGDDDIFDFSEQIFGEPMEPNDDKEKPKENKEVLSQNNIVHTSYLLVNALLNLLIKKGIIYPHEVNALVAELHAEFMKRKRGNSE